MCDLDSVRHKLGVDSDTAKLQLEKHDRELGVLMESIRRYGDFENTNFIVMGDHGQTDVAQVINFNRVFQDAGLQRLDENGKLEAFDAYCHSTGGSGWIELRDPNDASAARTCLPSAARHQGERKIQHRLRVYQGRGARAIPPDRSIRFHHRRKRADVLRLRSGGAAVYADRSRRRLQDLAGNARRPAVARPPDDLLRLRPRV
ncbi:MAG: alkaline phosphatase family protein [Christensenellales bacterium]